VGQLQGSQISGTEKVRIQEQPNVPKEKMGRFWHPGHHSENPTLQVQINQRGQPQRYYVLQGGNPHIIALEDVGILTVHFDSLAQ
jgi:hypothetical protein